MEIVRVSLDNTLNVYDFFASMPLAPGDIVVCDTARGLVLGDVIDTVPTSKKANRWIAQKVDMEDHKNRMAREKRKAELKAEMVARRNKLEDDAIYAQLAKEDEVIRGMLTEYNGLLD